MTALDRRGLPIVNPDDDDRQPAAGTVARPSVSAEKQGGSCVYPFQALGSRGISLELVPRVNGLPDEDTLVAAIARPDVVAVQVESQHDLTALQSPS